MENYTDRNDGCNESDILFYIEWAQQREPSIQFHIESVLNGVRVRHYSALNGSRQSPNVRCLFLYRCCHRLCEKGDGSFIWKSMQRIQESRVNIRLPLISFISFLPHIGFWSNLGPTESCFQGESNAT